MKAITHPSRKIFSLTIQLHDVKISAKSNKGQENQTKLDFVIDTSLKCLSKHRKRPLLIATEKPMRLFRPKTSQNRLRAENLMGTSLSNFS